MSMDVRKVKLDFNRTYQHDIPSVQGDTGRSIEFQIMNGSVAEDITGETVKIFGLKPDGHRVFNNAVITDAANGKCTIDLTQQMLCVAGTVQCTLVRYKNSQRVSSKKFNVVVDETVADDIEIESTSEYLALTDALSITKENLNTAVDTVIQQMLDAGDLANMTIKDNTITTDKYKEKSITPNKLSFGVQKNINKCIIQKDYGLFAKNGANGRYPNTDYYIVYVPITNLVLFRFNYQRISNFKVGFFNSNIDDTTVFKGTGLSDSYGVEYSIIKEAKDNGYEYIGITFSYADSPIDNLDVWFLALENENKDKIDIEIEGIEKDLFRNTENLIDYTKWKEGAGAWGNYISSKEGYKMSNLFEVEIGEKYFTNLYDNDFKLILFDENLGLVTKMVYNITPFANKVGLTIPEGVKYGCISILSNQTVVSNWDDIYFSKIDMMESRIEPLKTLNEKYIYINNDKCKEIQQGSWYYGKIISGLGDSLTAEGSGGHYRHFIKQYFNLKDYKNCGIGGTSVAGTGDTCFYQDVRINSLDINSDFITIAGGTNDVDALVDITKDEEFDMSNCDINSFVGAYNVMLSKIYYKFLKLDTGFYADKGINYSGIIQVDEAKERIPILLITPPPAFPEFSTLDNEKSKTQTSRRFIKMCEFVKRIGKMWGIPVADVYSEMQLNAFNQSKMFTETDKTHFLKIAHKGMAEVIIGKMKAIEPRF